MGRARNLKPAFFKNDVLAECSCWARLCFAGLWTLADREGRLEDRPKRIRAELFAFDDNVAVESLLAELHTHGFIQRYVVDGQHFIQVTEFLKHQFPHSRENASVIPAPKIVDISHDETKENPNITLFDVRENPRVLQSPGLSPLASTQKPGLSIDSRMRAESLSPIPYPLSAIPLRIFTLRVQI